MVRRHERSGRRIAARFNLVLIVAAMLTACAPFAATVTPDRLYTTVAGMKVDVSPQLTLPTGGDMKATLALQRIGDRPIRREIHILLSDDGGTPVENATVVVIGQMPGMNDGAVVQSTARADGVGRYVANMVFPMTGAYAMQVFVTGRGVVGSLRFELDIAG